jgi:hypothetical protein
MFFTYSHGWFATLATKKKKSHHTLQPPTILYNQAHTIWLCGGWAIIEIRTHSGLHLNKRRVLILVMPCSWAVPVHLEVHAFTK